MDLKMKFIKRIIRKINEFKSYLYKKIQLEEIDLQSKMIFDENRKINE